MDFGLYVRLLRRHWLVILLLAALGTAGGAAVALTQHRMYEARSQGYVTAPTASADTVQGYQGILLSQERAKSYAVLVTDTGVLRTVIDTLHLPYSVGTLQQHVSASNPPSTAVIAVSVTDRSPQRAKAVADAIGPALTRTVPGVRAVAAPGQALLTFTPAELPTAPVPQHRSLDFVLGAGAGLLLGLGAAVVRELTDTRVRDAHDLTRVSGLPVLGTVDHRVPLWPVSETYRRLRITCDSADARIRPKAWVVSAPAGGADTAAVAAGLAIASAEAGESVILVDADPAGHRLTALLGLTPECGLCEVLTGQASLDGALQTWRAGLPLSVLAAGTPEATPCRLPERALVPLVEDLTQRADAVVFAAPPALAHSDAVLLARAVGRAVVVVRARTTRGGELRRTVQDLRAVDATVLGAVLGRGRPRPVGSAGARAAAADPVSSVPPGSRR